MQKQNNSPERIEHALKNLALLLEPIKELVRGIQTNTIPWKICAAWTVCAVVILFFKIDHVLVSRFRFTDLYPYHPIAYKIYTFSFSTAAFWAWAWREVKKNRERLRLLTNAFKNAGLESKIGRFPNLISDFSIDPMTRKMRITNAGFPLMSFQNQSKFIESELGIFIDQIKENRERRVIEIIYSHFPMATEVKYRQDSTSRAYEFVVGQTRANTVTATFREAPHLMVAGQTNLGKSTFLRQLIVHLHLKHRGCNFLLIDLKGGLEFAIFENRKSFTVVPSVAVAIEQLKNVDKILSERMTFLKSNYCKDIEGYFKKKDKPSQAINLDRYMIVVDEAAEMFLAGQHAKSNDIQIARAVLSRVARQGRAVGVHLIVATQRPDTRSLDPQVKANLTGVLCFPMANDSSSIAVLGNGRATDLPLIPGRAIWKSGIEMLEVQTPFLPPEEAELLLGAPDDLPEEKLSNRSSDKGKSFTTAATMTQPLDPSQTE